MGTYQETSSHAPCQGTLGHSRLRSLSNCGLILARRVELVSANYISTSKKKKSAGGERMVEHSPKIRASEKKAVAATTTTI